VDLSQPIYADTVESQIVPGVGNNDQWEVDYELAADGSDADIIARIDHMAADILALKEGVNTIGAMMNGVADAVGQVMAQVQKGGIASLLGGLMGGKKNDE
jgi:hypothetical protein